MSNISPLQPGARMKRLLQILWLLQSGVRSADDLRLRFDVSRRTVFRDIQLLRDAGVPLIHDEETKCYRVIEDSLSYMHLEPIELVALAVGNEGHTLANLSRLRNYRDIAVAKLLRATESSIRRQVRRVLESLRQLNGDLPLDPTEESAVFVLIETWLESATQAAAKSSTAQAQPTS